MFSLYSIFRCGHCQALAPDWEKLAADWDGHDVGLVAEVDCDDQDAAELCEQFEIQGFPTLLYGDANDLENYEGDRSYEALSEFAKKTISKPICSVSNTENCDAEVKKLIQDLEKKDVEELKTMVKDADTKVSEAETLFEDEIEKLQKAFESLESAYNEKVSKIKDETNYKLVRALVVKKGGVLEDKDDLLDADFDSEDDEDEVGDEL